MIDLEGCAKILVREGKGLLAIDESEISADEKRLKLHGVEGGAENRRRFRDLFLSTPGIEKFLSGVILHDETLRQKNNEGIAFSLLLHDKGIVPGIKVDQSTEPMEDSPKEVITKGLIGLPERLQEYRNHFHTGFTKWRAVIRIEGDLLPTSRCLVENAKRIAQFAKATQEAGMVAIVEPEVLLEGKHSRLRAEEVLTTTLNVVFDVLREHHVDFSGIILKTSMALSGNKSGKIDTPQEVAESTVKALLSSVPHDILGIVFLSGGESSDQATNNLAAITRLAKEKNAPWPITFSFARALQDEALEVWKGEDAHVPEARKAFLSRLERVAHALN